MALQKPAAAASNPSEFNELTQGRLGAGQPTTRHALSVLGASKGWRFFGAGMLIEGLAPGRPKRDPALGDGHAEQSVAEVDELRGLGVAPTGERQGSEYAREDREEDGMISHEWSKLPRRQRSVGGGGGAFANRRAP